MYCKEVIKMIYYYTVIKFKLHPCYRQFNATCYGCYNIANNALIIVINNCNVEKQIKNVLLLYSTAKIKLHRCYRSFHATCYDLADNVITNGFIIASQRSKSNKEQLFCSTKIINLFCFAIKCWKILHWENNVWLWTYI